MEDPRENKRGNFKHELEDILFLVISAVVCGLNDWADIEMFGKGQLVWLRKFFPFKNGIPSHDTLGRVFQRLDTKAFSDCFTQWVSELSEHTKGELIAVDGKRMCGSFDRSSNKSALHIVSAYATSQKLCLQQVKIEAKSNEITAIPKLLEMLVLDGCTVSIDAMGCQKDITQKIVEKKGDYILGLKSNQKELLEQVKTVFSVRPSISQHEDHNIDHGRYELRKCDVITDFTFLDNHKDWSGLQSIVRVQSKRRNKLTEKYEEQTRYYISSKIADAEVFNKEIRSHWSIENKLHWMLDVNFKEDKNRKRKGNSAYNFNMLTKIVLGLLEKETSKISKSGKRTKAAFDPVFREKLLQI